MKPFRSVPADRKEAPQVPEQSDPIPSITLPSIDWNASSDGERLRAGYWKRKSLELRAKAPSTESATRDGVSWVSALPHG